VFTGHRLRAFLRRCFGRGRIEAAKQGGVRMLRAPTQCVLWEDPKQIALPAKLTLELVESYVESSHLDRCLFRCPECGQLYFYEFYEWVDWQEGNDKQYVTYFPVEGAADLEELKAESEFGLMRFYPRLHWDAASPHWNGK
jgi:hypothetical protein